MPGQGLIPGLNDYRATFNLRSDQIKDYATFQKGKELHHCTVPSFVSNST